MALSPCRVSGTAWAFGVWRCWKPAACGSYNSTLEAIDRRCGHRAVGKRQVEHLVRASAADVTAFYAQRIPIPAGKRTLLVISVDGKGIVIRLADLRVATRKAAERSAAATRMYECRIPDPFRPTTPASSPFTYASRRRSPTRRPNPSRP